MAAPDQQPYPGYVYHEYPKYKYHADGLRERIVADVVAEEALGTWWFDTPSEADHAIALALQAVARAEQPRLVTPPTSTDGVAEIVAALKATPRKRKAKEIVQT